MVVTLETVICDYDYKETIDEDCEWKIGELNISENLLKI